MTRTMLWILLVFTVAFLRIRPASASAECDVEYLHNCLNTLQKLLEVQFESLKKSEQELDQYCHAIEQESECLTQSLDDCKETVPLIKKFYSLIETYEKNFCVPGADKRKLYLKTVPCLDKYESKFKECEQNKYDEKDLKSMCSAMKKSMTCVEDKSYSTCGKDGKDLVVFLKAPWKGLMKEQCKDFFSSQVKNQASYWSFILPLLTIFLLSYTV